MVRVALVLSALLVVCNFALAADAPRKVALPEYVVVVDPMDLRQPVADPERELSQKYNEQTVRYTGELHHVGHDSKNKTYWYDFQTVIQPPKQQAKSKKTTNAKPEIVTVTVYFQNDEKRLRNASARITATILGRGEISTDGRLIIRQARVQTLEEKAKK
jgi:hypothetical protein